MCASVRVCVCACGGRGGGGTAVRQDFAADAIAALHRKAAEVSHHPAVRVGWVRWRGVGWGGVGWGGVGWGGVGWDGKGAEGERRGVCAGARPEGKGGEGVAAQ